MPDWKIAGIAAFGLLGTAVSIAFIIHLIGGFDIRFLFVLLPGVWLAVILSLGGFPKLGPILSHTFLPFALFSYVWYFVLSYLVIKIFPATFRLFRDAR
jgi:hypothetical protein